MNIIRVFASTGTAHLSKGTPDDHRYRLLSEFDFNQCPLLMHFQPSIKERNELTRNSMKLENTIKDDKPFTNGNWENPEEL